MTDRKSGQTEARFESGSTAQQRLPPAALRALAEAEARRKSYLDLEAALPRELGGRGGKDPVRYGDWEVKGLAADF
jgi:hypothetical protein